MGARKRLAKESRKNNKKTIAIAKLNNCPSSPRKMRLVANMIRGKKTEEALLILKYSKKEASQKLKTLLTSAISNWKVNNLFTDQNMNLFIKEIKVDVGTSLKRLRTAPQGRGHRIRKRSNHVTIVIDKK